MQTFDDALKYLAQGNPGDFIRFALVGSKVDVVKPLPSSLPSRRREIDGCYLILVTQRDASELCVAHFEFHRRKQGLDDLAIDLAEAQIRLFRRERKRVVSLVWDLYGKQDEPLLERRTLTFGADIRKRSSQSVYLRVNLRAIAWRDLLRNAPASLWPLIVLTRDGAQEEAIVNARDAIHAQENLGFSARIDYIAILRFVAEAERVPRQLLETLLAEESIMSSQFYKSVIARGRAEGVAEGVAQGVAQGEKRTLTALIVEILERRLGGMNDEVRKRILSETNLDTLKRWKDLAFDAIDAQSARMVVEQIRKTRTA